jgi:hypothetical protein
MRVKLDAENTALGRTFARDADKANAFSKLSRYETTIERGLYKALHKLQRLQAARAAAGSVPPPAAVDVDVSGIPEGDRYCFWLCFAKTEYESCSENNVPLSSKSS